MSKRVKLDTVPSLQCLTIQSLVDVMNNDECDFILKCVENRQWQLNALLGQPYVERLQEIAVRDGFGSLRDCLKTYKQYAFRLNINNDGFLVVRRISKYDTNVFVDFIRKNVKMTCCINSSNSIPFFMDEMRYRFLMHLRSKGYLNIE